MIRRVVVSAALVALIVATTGSTLNPLASNGKGRNAASTIALKDGSQLWLGGSVSFLSNAAGLAGWEYPQVAVWCYQGDAAVYMKLDNPAAVFVLGGSGSLWVATEGPARCEGILYAYGSKGGQLSVRKLASAPFDAAGSGDATTAPPADGTTSAQPTSSPTDEPSLSGATSSPSPSLSPSPSGSSTHMVTPEGATIDIASDVTGWTAQQIYDYLKPNAYQLELVGPDLTIKVQTLFPSQTVTTASSSGGIYTSFRATMYLKGVDSTFVSQPDAIIAHEYGHAWTLYHLYMSQNGDWTSFLDSRWTTADGSLTLATDSRLDSSYSWDRAEIIAEDYRLLFGSSLAISELSHMNTTIPDPRSVPGLRDFFLTRWAGG